MWVASALPGLILLLPGELDFESTAVPLLEAESGTIPASGVMSQRMRRKKNDSNAEVEVLRWYFELSF